MIPESLHVEGLHSYRDSVTVDFDELVEDGLFGVFGPTGSGKSTLLDAMTFSLYGEVDRVGGNEVAPLMHPEAEDLEVRYGFELGGTSYEARRRYRRPGAEGTPSLREAELRDLDAGEVLASQAREVQEEVQGLLGMDFDQFTRAVFLPQGKFAQFLEDTPAQRVKLLEEVFGLDRYGERLRRRARRRHDELEKRRENLRGELQGLDDATPERLEKVEAAHGEAAERVADLEKRLEELEPDVEAARDLRKTRGELEEAREELEELEEQDEEIDEDREVLAAAEAAQDPVEALEELEDERGTLAQVEEDLEEARTTLEEAEEALDEAKARREETVPELEAREEALHQVEPRLRDLADEAEDRASDRDRAEALRDEIASLEEDGAEAPPEDLAADPEDLEDRARRGRDAAAEVAELEEELEATGSDLEEAREQVEDLEERRAELAHRVDDLEETVEDLEARQRAAHQGDEAAALATELEEGEPCPVCGADHHPDPADEPEEDPAALRAELEEAREALQEARAEAEGVGTRLEEREAEVERLRDEAEGLEAELEDAREREADLREGLPPELAEADWDEARDRARAWRRGQRTAHRRERLEEVEARLETARQRWGDVRETLDLHAEDPTPAALEEARDRLRTSVEAVEAERARLDEAVEEAREAALEAGQEAERLDARRETLAHRVEDLEEDLEAAVAGSPFEEAEAAREAHRPPERREALRERIEEHEEELRRAQEAVERLEGEVEAAGLDADEAEAVLEEHEAVQEDIQEARDERARLATILEGLREDVERRAEIEEELDDVDEGIGRAEALRSLLRGRGFVQFLARSRFQSVLDHASRRLSQVSGGRYHLQGDPQEIHIVDHLEGAQERDLRTLSGGETFMASLALALALSDAIQGERGGGYPPVDFFFLDEGFGSLDRDSLDTVMRMLRELVDQGVHVGLITHVTDVQKYVPRRLLVEPADESAGSRVRIER